MKEMTLLSLRAIPISVWVLGFVSMLMDISSEMIHSLLPLFMVTTLGTSALLVGFIEGLAQSTALIVKIFSGMLSDYLGKRKWLAVTGYALGAFTKPVFALASSIELVFTARLLDRVGKGIRGTPRDAMVADLTPPELRGAAFGLRQSLDSIGAFVGPLLAVGLMLLWANDFRAVFWVAVIPGILSVLLLAFGISEPDTCSTTKRTNPLVMANLKRLNSQYWWVVCIGSVFTLARFSEAFLVLRAQDSSVPITYIPLIIVLMNIIYALSAYPFGHLSDHISRYKLLGYGLLMLICADIALAINGHWSVLLLGVVFWGLHMGLTQGILAALVADVAPQDLRGTAFGFFNLASGIALFAASIIAGWLWDSVGASATFLMGAGFCSITLLLIIKAKHL